MFVYEKRLQYPVKITQTNPKLAMAIATQYGGAYCHIDQWNKIIEIDRN